MKWILLLIPSLLAAHPTGGQTIAGSIEISQNGTQCTIRAADKSVIHWDHFGIDRGESLSFIQPGTSSSVLNRVTGKTISEINGFLQANGQVFLVNPNGIVIGSEGMIQTAGFLASTLDLMGNGFDPNNPLEFQGEGAAISNLGQIRGEEWVCLIAPEVSNHGIVEGGSVAIGSSRSVFVGSRSRENIWIELGNEGDPNPFAHAINLEGVVRAGLLSNESGQIVIKGEGIALRGTLDAPGGSISVLGKKIDMPSDSYISASGVENQSSGDVIIRASDLLTFNGKIDAKGGPLGGDGGFVEVSGKSMLFNGLVDRTSLHGEAGSLLIDPSDILITGATTGNVMFAANTYSVNAALPSPATIDAGDIIANLGLGPVTVTTSSAFGDVGNITLTSPIVWGSGFNFTLLADGSITLQGVSILDNSNAQITLTAQNSITLDAGSITSMAGGNISLTATNGDVNLLATFVGGTASVRSFGGDIVVVAGQDVNLINNGNPVSAEVFIGVLPGGGFTSITAGRDILLDNQALATTFNPAGIGGSSTLTLNAGRDVILRNPSCFLVTATGDLDVTAGRNVSLDSNCGFFSINPNAVITIVTDNQAPVSPQVGDGGLIMDPSSIIGFDPVRMTPSLNIRIYTVRPSQNNITLLNWTSFAHDPLQVDSATEVYGVYFPSAIPITSPLQYIVFYKTRDPLVPNSAVADLAQEIPQVISSGFEFLRKFAYRHPYSLLNEVERFWTMYDSANPTLNRTFHPFYMMNYREFTP